VKKLSALSHQRSAVPVLFAILLLGAGCGGGSGGSSQRVNRDTLSERQQDSMLSKSSIPGARGVGRAMTAADSISARVQASDTVQ